MANLDLQDHKVLLITVANLNFGELLSLAFLINILKSQTAKVDLLTAGELPNLNVLPEINKITEIASKRFVLSLDKGTDQIKNIQWQQTDTQLTFYIGTEQGQFKAENFALTQEGADYDTIIYFGVNSYAEIEKYFANYPTLIYQVRHISIGGKFTVDNQTVELIETPAQGLIGEAIYANSDTTKIDAAAANLLLASVIKSTSNFTTANASVLRLSAELLEKGANIEEAQKILAQDTLVA